MSSLADVELAHSVYPERLDRKENTLDRWTRNVVGSLWHGMHPFGARLRQLARSAAALSGEIEALEFKPEVRRKLFRDNALRVYKL